MQNFWNKFLRNTQGALAPAMALLIPVVASAVGVSVDLSRAYLVHDRLVRALDAAGLAAASSSGNEAAIEKRFQDFFAANYPDAALGDPYDLDIVQTDHDVTVQASANVETTFMRIIGVDHLEVDAKAVVKKSLRGMEIALVLDNTGSMRTNNNIGTLRTAAKNFINILYDRVEDDNQVRVTIVPYAAMVNPGATGATLVNNPYATPYNVSGLYAPYSTTDKYAWKGCMLERNYPNDIQDTSVAAGGKWTPFRWQDSSDNDWSPTIRDADTYCDDRTTPNLGCPTPIIPLTSNRTTLVNETNKLLAWCRGGTMGNIGLAWGVRALSPEAPFTEGHSYSDDAWRKTIVMMTDGNNEVFCYNNNCGTQTNSDMSAYGRVSSGKLGTTTRTGALAEVNRRMTEACTYAKNKGITIYTITFSTSLNATTRDLYRKCATDSSKYYNAPTQQDLINVFEQISRELSNLHISE